MLAGKWSRWGIRAGALVLASFLWLYAVTEHRYTREANATVQVHDPAPGGVREILVASPVPEEVKIRVAGRGRDLLRVDEESFIVRLEPEGVPGAVRKYRLTAEMVQCRANADVTVEAVVEPSEVEIALDWRAERVVPVRVQAEIEPAEPYVLVGKITVDPRTAAISGPSSHVIVLDSVETESLELTGVEEDVDRFLQLRVPAGTRITVDPPRVRIRAEVQLLAQDELTRVPVRIRSAPADRYRPEPAQVRVRVKGGIDVIANIEPASDVVLFVDALDYRGEGLPVRYEEPELFQIVDITPRTVHLVEQ